MVAAMSSETAHDGHARLSYSLWEGVEQQKEIAEPSKVCPPIKRNKAEKNQGLGKGKEKSVSVGSQKPHEDILAQKTQGFEKPTETAMSLEVVGSQIIRKNFAGEKKQVPEKGKIPSLIEFSRMLLEEDRATELPKQQAKKTKGKGLLVKPTEKVQVPKEVKKPKGKDTSALPNLSKASEQPVKKRKLPLQAATLGSPSKRAKFGSSGPLCLPSNARVYTVQRRVRVGYVSIEDEDTTEDSLDQLEEYEKRGLAKQTVKVKKEEKASDLVEIYDSSDEEEVQEDREEAEDEGGEEESGEEEEKSIFQEVEEEEDEGGDEEGVDYEEEGGEKAKEEGGESDEEDEDGSDGKKNDEGEGSNRDDEDRKDDGKDEENKIEDEGDMSQATQQVLPIIDEETPFHKGDAMSTQEVVEHESDFVAQKPSNDMNKGSENMLPTIGETQIHEGNTRNSEEKMVVVENQSDVQTSPKPLDDMIIKDTYSMPLRDEEVEGSEKKDEANEEHQGALATTEEDAKIAYCKFRAFEIMYMEVCRSPNYNFRRSMMEVLMKAFAPPSTGIHQGWEIIWNSTGGIFFISATKFEYPSIDLKKLRWAHELQVIQVFYFLGTFGEVKIIVDVLKTTLNRWVFDQLKNVILSDRIKPNAILDVFPLNENLVPPSVLYTAVQEKKLLFKLAQPPNFKGEGANVERNAEVWLEAMDDYFEDAGTHPQNQMMLAMFKLTGDAKIWWKMHCQDFDIIGTSQSWEKIKDAVTARYLPPAHKATKMNE
ncbi:hypothetical protein L7F22_030922 [Adiantum nelumboides]|nr:hypothetical protein [Adiantum nelumboides]